MTTRTISMILTVPNAEELISPTLDPVGATSPSIPIYHGTIIHIEQHHDNENTSDLIVRVPNFQHLSFPIVTVSIDDGQLGETASQRSGSMKRRAPICPIRADSPKVETPSKSVNTKRLAVGLRQLSRALAANCKSKQSTTVDEITIIPVLPDVEVITENFQVTTKNKTSKTSSSVSKILLIKRKYLPKMKRKQPSSQTNTEDNTNEMSLTENEPVEQSPEETTTIAQLIPKIPILAFDSDTSSRPQSVSPVNNEEIYVVHPNGDTYSECYEVTYQFDPQFLDDTKEQRQIRFENTPTDPDPFAYQDLASAFSGWLPVKEVGDVAQYTSITDQPESSSVVCLNDLSPVINEDYRVIIQLLERVLQTGIDMDYANNEFNRCLQEDESEPSK